MLRKHGAHRTNVVVVLITIVTMSVTMYRDAREAVTQSKPVLLLRTHLSSLVCGTARDTFLMAPLVSASLGMRLSWLCQLGTGENSLRRESQLRDCLDKIGLWACLPGIALVVN